jgi:hypothetical protein
MNYAKRTDRNLKEIAQAFREMHCSVLITNAEFDLIVGINGFNLLIEVKDGLKPPSQAKLTKSQSLRASSWKGIIHVIRSVDEAITLVKRYSNMPMLN